MIARREREILTDIANEHPCTRVDYVPGRWHETNAEGRTRWSYRQAFQPAAGLRNDKVVTGPVTRLINAGLAEHESADAEHRCRVIATGAGLALLAEYGIRTRRDEQYPQGGASRFHGQALLHNIELSRTADGDLLDLIAEQILGAQELRDWRGARHMAAVRAAAEAEHNGG